MTPLQLELPESVKVRKKITLDVKTMMIRQLNLDLHPEEIDNDAPLFGMGLGLDSVDALELMVGLEQEFKVLVSEKQSKIFRSVNTIVDFVVTPC